MGVSMKLLQAALAAAAIAATGPTVAQAAAIIAPVSVTASSTIGSFWTASRVIDQSGLSIGYTAGVTDFDEYLAKGVTHSGALNTEWQGAQEARSGRLVFDFGREVTLYKLAIWDENNSVQRSMSISTPALGLIRSFSPPETREAGYGASPVYAFKPVTTRYLTLDIAGCGSDDEVQTVPWCGLGEIVFADGSGAAIPEPATWAMMILGFAGVGAAMRSRRPALA